MKKMKIQRISLDREALIAMLDEALAESEK